MRQPPRKRGRRKPHHLGSLCGSHRGGVQLILEFAHRFRGADIITPRLDLSQSFVPKRGPDSGETADLEVARGAPGAPTFGGLLLAFLVTWPTKNASRRMIIYYILYFFFT